MLRHQYTDDDGHEPLQEVLSAFLVSESFAVDVISHLSISTCINDDEDDDDDGGGDGGGDGGDGDLSLIHI